MKIYEIKGYFGYWGMMSTVSIKAKNKTEAFRGLKKKVMKIYQPYGRGRTQKKFHCTPIGYRVIQELEKYKDIIKKGS